MALKWNGAAVLSRVRNAQIEGVNRVMAKSVQHAKANHAWQNRTGILEGSIGIDEFARPSGGGVSGVWGSRDVEYAIFQELGTSKMAANPFLRPAADAQYPGLPSAIRRAYERGRRP